jgi:hypothetical protein
MIAVIERALMVVYLWLLAAKVYWFHRPFLDKLLAVMVLNLCLQIGTLGWQRLAHR